MTTLFARALFHAGNRLVRVVATVTVEERNPLACGCYVTTEEGTCTTCGSRSGSGITEQCAGVMDGFRCGERVPEGEHLCLLCEVDEAAQSAGVQALAEAT